MNNLSNGRASMRGQPTKENAVGYCYHSSHTGWLTEKMMKQHDCLGKQCKYFRKLETNPYWYRRDVKKALSKIKKNGYGVVTINGTRYLTQDYKKLCDRCRIELKLTKCFPIVEYSKL